MFVEFFIFENIKNLRQCNMLKNNYILTEKKKLTAAESGNIDVK